MAQFSYQNLLDAGFTEAEAKKAFTDKLTAAGFAQSEVNSYLQNVSGVRPTSLAGDEQNTGITQFAQNIDKVTQEARSQGVDLGFKDAIQRGWQQSVMGMLKEGKMPRELTPEEEASLNFFERLAMGVSEVVSDTPIYFAGGKVGALATGAAGAAIGTVAPGIGNAVGGGVGLAVGGAAGAFGFHRMARTALIDMYQRGEVADFDELVYRVTHASKEFGKGAVVGAATGGAGKLAGVGGKAIMGAAATRSGAAAVALKAGAKATPVGGEILGLTVSGSAVEGQIPTAQDFLDSATMILTLKGAHKATDVGINRLKNTTVLNNLYKRFAENGEHPKDVMNKAAHDPLELQKVLTEQAPVLREAVNEIKPSAEAIEDFRREKIERASKSIEETLAKQPEGPTGSRVLQQDALHEIAEKMGPGTLLGLEKITFEKGIGNDVAGTLPKIMAGFEPVEKDKTSGKYRLPFDSKKDVVISYQEPEGKLAEITMGFEDKKPGAAYSKEIKTAQPAKAQKLQSRVEEIKQQIVNPQPEAKAEKVSASAGGKGGFDYRVEFPFDKKEAMPAGKVDAKDAATKQKILEDLKKPFDVPVRNWKVPRQGRGAQGLFYPRSEMIRVKYANDIATTAHELGHYLEQKMYGEVGSASIMEHYDELRQFASKPRGRATKSSVAGEGFAQFLSTYVVNPNEAKTRAPKFYEHFEKELQAKEPEIYSSLQETRALVEKFVKQPAVMEVLSSVSVREDGKPAMTTKEKWQAFKNSVKVKWLDDKAPLLRIVEQLEQKSGKKVDFSKNPYYLARLFPGWVGRAEAFIEHGSFDFNTLKDTGKSFRQIIEPVENLDELRAYLISKRVIELHERSQRNAHASWRAALDAGKSPGEAIKLAADEIIETGIRPEVAAQTVKELEGKYSEVAKELYNYQNALLKYQLDGGLISYETYLKVLKDNQYRVPFYRVMEGGKDYTLGSKTMASKQVLKRIKGSTRTIIDPLEGIIKDTYETINAVERNRVGQALADLSKLEGAGEFVFRIDNPVKGVKTFDDGKQHFTSSPNIEKDNQIKVFIKGKPYVYEVDKDVAALINGLNPNEANAFIRSARFFTNSLRAGATVYNFAFTVRNFLRDSIFAFLLTNSKYNPAVHAMGGAKAAIKKDEAYWQFKKAGGDQASFFSVDRNSLQKEILTLEKTGYAKSVWNLVKAKEFAAAWEAGVLEPMRYPGEISELSTRLGEFKKSVSKHGDDKAGLEKSGYAAREITIDFAKAGINARAINMVAAFFNANLQGFVKTGEVLGKHTLKAATFLGTLGMLEAIINYDWKKGKEDEDVAELPRAQRNINYVFKVGDTIYRLPKPQQIGFVSTMFSQMTTAALDRMNNNDRDDLLRNAAKAFANEFDMNPMPNAFAVPIELWANKSFFFDRPIVPVSAENLLPEYQYTQNTTELTKFISSKLGGWIGKENTFSPAKAEHIVRGWTGGVGTTVLKATDLALRKAGIVPDPVKPAPTLSDIPFVKGFVMRHPSSSAESIQRFYEEYQNRMKKYNSFKAMAKQMNVGETNELSPYAAYGGLNAVYRGMSENGAAIRNIYNNPEMSADEKRQNIDQLYLIQIQLAKEGLNTIKQIDKQMEEMKAAAKNQ